MRVSMHPGQYTVLNTPVDAFSSNALADLDYHASILDLMGLDDSHKIDLHIGGVYGDKDESIKTFMRRYNSLPSKIKNRLTLENDERNFSAEDVLNICKREDAPGTLDIFHHQILPSIKDKSIRETILLFAKTWPGSRQAIHYSNQDLAKKPGAHSKTIDLDEFDRFYTQVQDLDLDIMLEVKDKQDSVLKIKKAYPEID